MKRLIMLAVLCAFVFSAASAFAVDMNVNGHWIVESVWKANWDFDDEKDRNNDAFDVWQRARVGFDFIANENLKAVLLTSYGEQRWGRGALNVGSGTAAVNPAWSRNYIQVKNAYIDFNWPETEVNIRAGYQGVALPGAVGGSYILDDDVAALAFSGPITDQVSYMLAYGRLDKGRTGTGQKNYRDAYIAVLPMNFDGFSFQPFGVYANMGPAYPVAGAAAQDDGFWLGAAFTMDLFDPFEFSADLNYGNVDAKSNAAEASGWLFDIAVSYKGFDFMTPELTFAYTSGEDGDATDGSERLPLLSGDWAIGSFWFGGDTLMQGAIGNNQDALGFWAFDLAFHNIKSFAEGLSHTVHIVYAKGNNDRNSTALLNYGTSLTEKDSLWELDFNTAYQIYDELTLSFDLGYVNLDASSSVWGANNTGGDAWKVSTGLNYEF